MGGFTSRLRDVTVSALGNDSFVRLKFVPESERRSYCSRYMASCMGRIGVVIMAGDTEATGPCSYVTFEPFVRTANANQIDQFVVLVKDTDLEVVAPTCVVAAARAAFLATAMHCREEVSSRTSAHGPLGTLVRVRVMKPGAESPLFDYGVIAFGLPARGKTALVMVDEFDAEFLCFAHDDIIEVVDDEALVDATTLASMREWARLMHTERTRDPVDRKVASVTSHTHSKRART